MLLFFRTDCPVCVRRAPGWTRLAEDLGSVGKRLVLVGLDPRDPIEDFKTEHGLAAVTHVVMGDRRDATKLGVFGVPNMIGLDADMRVAFTEADATAPSRVDGLALAGRRVEGLERQFWQRAVDTIFGEGHELGAVPSEVGDALPVRGPDGEELHLHVLRAPANTGAYLEIAAGVDAAGTLRGLLPLQTGRYLRFLAPAFEQVQELRGLSLEDARKRARGRADERTASRPVWMSLAYALAALEHKHPAHGGADGNG